MIFHSTRDKHLSRTGSQAILEGLAPDGGLYVPETIPQLDFDWDDLTSYSYQEMSYFILKEFFDEFDSDALKEMIDQAYNSDSFDTEKIAPLSKIGDIYYLELFHGQTLAFKDMALSILPYLMRESARINENLNDVLILTATSGDTGKAAMAGFANVDKTKIIVFYPEGGVSTIQELQMTTQEGRNTFVYGIKGNFDDAQSQVKRLFNDEALKDDLLEEGTQFSSANSMNIGRLFPQVIYYFYAYAQLLTMGTMSPGEEINVTVPTGNFGNILAAYYAKQMGLPLAKLVCASNDNTVLYDFFQSGTYNKNRDFKVTTSPSMDILLSSNFERLLYYAVGEETDRLRELMNELETHGSYTVSTKEFDGFKDFVGAFASESEVADEMNQVWNDSHYIIDPHTAVASKACRKYRYETEDERPHVVVSTASPYKFPEAILIALGEPTHTMTVNDMLAKLNHHLGGDYPQAIKAIQNPKIRHDDIISIQEMEDVVTQVAQLDTDK